MAIRRWSLSSGRGNGAEGWLVLGVFWLAWPDLHRLPRWVWYVLPIGFVVLIYARGFLVFLIPALAMAAIFYMLYRKVWRSPPR